MEQGEETMEQGEEQVMEEEAAAAEEETDEEREEEEEAAEELRHEPQSGSSDRGKCLVPETQPERCGLAARTRQLAASAFRLTPRCVPHPAPCVPCIRSRLPRAPCPRSESPSDEMPPPPPQPDQRFAVPPPPMLPAGPVVFMRQAGFVPETQLSQ